MEPVERIMTSDSSGAFEAAPSGPARKASRFQGPPAAAPSTAPVTRPWPGVGSSPEPHPLEAFLNGPTPVVSNAKLRPILHVSNGEGMSRAVAPMPRPFPTAKAPVAAPVRTQSALTSSILLSLLRERPRSMRELEALFPEDEAILTTLVADYLTTHIIERGPAGNSSDAPLSLTVTGLNALGAPGPETPGEGPGPREPWRRSPIDPKVALVPFPQPDNPRTSPSAYQAWSAEISPKGTRTRLIGGDANVRESQERARIRRAHTSAP